MIIDVHVFAGTSINGYEQQPEELIRRMNDAGIDRSVISPVQPRTYHLETENTRIGDWIKRYPDRLTGFCRVDPRLGQEALKELKRSVLELGLKGLFLHPWEEGYRIHDDASVEVVRTAGDLGVPVLVAAGYPWVSHALQVGELAGKCPETSIVMTNGGQINISGLAQSDAFLALSSNANLYIETSGLYRQDFIEDVIRELGPERVLFGSGSPRMNQKFELKRAQSATARSALIQEKVLGQNAMSLLNIEKV